MRIFCVSCRSAMNFVRESPFVGARRNSGSVWRSAFATTNSDGGTPGRMVRSQEPNESQTSLGATCAPKSLTGVVSACEHRPNGPILSLSRCIGNSRSRLRFETGSMTGWWAASSISTVSTIQSFQTADLRAGSKDAVSVGIFAGIIPLVRSLVTLAVSQADFSLPSLHPKIPFPASGFSTARSRSAAGNFWGMEAKGDVSNPVHNYCGFNPRASNCWLHSAGASRSRSTPIPRGKRPSTAARTRSGARNASEIVMLT